jgi:hypothetical protein
VIQFVVLQLKACADSPKQTSIDPVEGNVEAVAANERATEKTPAEKHPRDQVTAAAPLAAEREHPAQSQEGRGGSAPTTQAKRRAKDGNGPVEPKKSRKV